MTEYNAQAVLAARQRREISRETYLGFLGFDQQVEATRMEQRLFNTTRSSTAGHSIHLQ